MNAYFICVIVRVQMWFMYTQLLDDQTQKDFWVVYLFLKVFLCITCVLKVFPKIQICFVKKHIQKHFCEYVASKLSRTLVAKIRKQIFISSKVLHREFHDSLARSSWEIASCETRHVHLRHFASNSQELRE